MNVTKPVLLSGNPVPLPPRDRSKPLATAKPRHQRKHPLIIPGNAMRTLARIHPDTKGKSRSAAEQPQHLTLGDFAKLAPDCLNCLR